MRQLLVPGMWGCAHGSGVLGAVIRSAEIEMSKTNRFPQGDRVASWAGHCMVYVGQQNFGTAMVPHPAEAVVEATWPRVRLVPLASKQGVIWATGQPMTAAQRTLAVSTAMRLVGERYDWPAYLEFTARVLQVGVTKDLRPLLANPRWSICSGVVVKVQEAIGTDLGPLRTAATQSPDFIAPGDCMRWGLDNAWMESAPPSNW